MAGQVGAGQPLSRGRVRLLQAEVVRAGDVPVHLGRPACWALVRVHRPRHPRQVSAHARLQRALPPGFRRLRPAGGERGHQERRPPRRLHQRQHGAHDRPVSNDGRSLPMGSQAGDLGPQLLPLDPVAVPAALSQRPRLQGQGAGQLVPQGPDRAGQRAGRQRPLRTLRHPGGQEGAGAVVLPHHRLRRGAAQFRRPGLARARGHDADQLDRPQRRARGRLHGCHHRRRGGEDADLHHPVGHPLRRHFHGACARAPAGPARHHGSAPAGGGGLRRGRA